MYGCHAGQKLDTILIKQKVAASGMKVMVIGVK